MTRAIASLSLPGDQGGPVTSTSATTVRPVFFVSDGTAITAETLGSALLLNFGSLAVERRTIPFVDSLEGARDAVATIAESARPGIPPLVFATIKDPVVRAVLESADAVVIDLLGTHLSRLEAALGTRAGVHRGTAHSLGDLERYHARMWAVEYAIEHDDGQSMRAIDRADVILIAPSRCGKTPTALYLALQHGLLVANYPLTDDDRFDGELPPQLRPYADRCFGLTTTVQRLVQVREARRAHSRYASLAQCRAELRRADDLYRRHGIPVVNSADKSVEEMAAVILHTIGARAGMRSEQPRERGAS